MPDLNDIVAFLTDNLYIIIAMAVIIFFFFKFWKQSGESKYKPVILAREIRHLMDEAFSINQEKHGYGKTLFIGSRDSGYILQSIEFPFIEEFKISLKDNIDYKNQLKLIKEAMKQNKYTEEFYSEKLALLKKDHENKINTIKNKFFGFKTCGKGRIKRIMAMLGIGLNYFIINKNLIEETDSSFWVTYESRPELYLGIWVYDNPAKRYLDHETFKINREQELNSMINYLPKLAYHDLELSKNKASLEYMAELDQAKKKGMIENMKKGN